MRLDVPATLNPFRSLTPRAVPLPMLQGAMCNGPSPFWSALAAGNADEGLRLLDDWLHVNKVLFGRKG